MRSKTYKKLILETLKQTPIVDFAVKKHGVSRATFYRWKSSDPEFSAAVETALEEGRPVINDLAESRLLKLIGDGHFHAIKFWLEKNCLRYGNHTQDFDEVAYRKKVEEELFGRLLETDYPNVKPNTMLLKAKDKEV